MKTFVPVIGLEVHARLNTKTKFFCRCKNEPIPAYPNAHVCPICMGHPGALPQPNQEAITLGITAALALGCTINEFSKFDRKNYFYPDLPMGYQISQFDQPIAEHGHIIVERADGTEKTIGIERLHLENDAGKLTHHTSGSLVDYNRAGAPLMEIVSCPDMRSVEEASLYVRQLQMIIRSCGASEADMEKGMMRFDINISLRENEDAPFGTKVELKNLNSFRSLEKAISYEMQRQAELLNNGEKIIQETRGWDDEKEITVSQRSKEIAADYRYFPEPDIPPIITTTEVIEHIRKSLPELPYAKKQRLSSTYDLSKDMVQLLLQDSTLCQYYEDIYHIVQDKKAVTTWVLSVLLGLLNEEKLTLAELPFNKEAYASLIMMVLRDEISQLSAKEIAAIMIVHGGDPLHIATEKGLLQVSDTNALQDIALEVIASFPAQKAEYQSGKEALLGFFVGQCMKKSAGSGNPKIFGELLKTLLAH